MTGLNRFLELLILGLALCGLVACDDDDGGMEDAGPPPGVDAGPPDLSITFEALSTPSEIQTITAADFLPGPDVEMLLASHEGTLHHLRIDGADVLHLGSFSVADADFRQEGDCGLLQVAVDPDWANNGFVWLSHCGAGQETVLRRVTFDGTDYASPPGTSLIILNLGPGSVNHSGGSMGFEDDGTMWLGIGDKGTETGQDDTNLFGTIIRIVPNRDPAGAGEPYEPATGNAYDGSGSERAEIFVNGMRYPWRITRDRLGRFWSGDVGEGLFEEVNLTTAAGENFGWGFCEGPCDPAQDGLIDPILAWDRGSDHPYFRQHPDSTTSTRRVVWVGEAYDPSVQDRYSGLMTDRITFGDTCLGWVRGAWADESGELQYDRPMGTLPHVTMWEQGSDGFLYVGTFGSCDALDPFDPPALFRVVLDEG